MTRSLPFFLAAADLLAAGSWLALRPGDLFALLQTQATSDGVLLARVLGALALAQGGLLVLASLRADARGLAWGALAGRGVELGLAAYLLGTTRVLLPRTMLLALLGHAAVGLVLVAGGLWANRKDGQIVKTGG